MPVEAPVTIDYWPWHGSSLTGLQHDLGHVVLLIVEHTIPVRRLFERHPVRDQEGRIDLPSMIASSKPGR